MCFFGSCDFFYDFFSHFYNFCKKKIQLQPSGELREHCEVLQGRSKSKLVSYYLFFSFNLPLVFIFKCHFDDHHLGEVLQGRSKSKFNIILSYRAGEPANFFPGSWLFFQAAPAPAPDFFPKRLRLRFLVFLSSGSGSDSGSKESKTPGSDRLRLRLLTID